MSDAAYFHLIAREAFKEDKSISSWLFGEYKDRATLSLFGVDVKITPDDEVKIIEINGANFGMKGFPKAYGNALSKNRADIRLFHYLKNFADELGLPLLIYPWGHSTMEQYLFNELGFTVFNLEKQIVGWDDTYYQPVKAAGRDVDFYKLKLGMELQHEKPHGRKKLLFLKDYRKAKAIVWNRIPKYFRFNENRHLVINSDPIAAIADDKLRFAYEIAKGSELFPRTLNIDGSDVWPSDKILNSHGFRHYDA